MATGNCKNCGKPLNDKRHDAQFCDARCVAAWTRNEGYHRERFHAEREEQKAEHCQYCGNEFFFNSYADRGGNVSLAFAPINVVRLIIANVIKKAHSLVALIVGKTGATTSRTEKAQRQPMSAPSANAKTIKTTDARKNNAPGHARKTRTKIRHAHAQRLKIRHTANKRKIRHAISDGQAKTRILYSVLRML